MHIYILLHYYIYLLLLLHKSCTVFIRSSPSLLELTYMLLQNDCINNGVTNGLK